MKKYYYLGVEVSAEVYAVLNKTKRKMRYQASLKNEKFIENQEKQIAKFIPSREDSYDRLCDEEHREFASSAISPEDAVIHKDEIARLHKALARLSPDELALVSALFFEGMTEREYAKRLGLSQPAVHYKKVEIQTKLKKFLEI